MLQEGRASRLCFTIVVTTLGCFARLQCAMTRTRQKGPTWTRNTQPHQALVRLDLFAERSCCCKCGRQSIPECIAVARKRTAPMWSNCALKSGRWTVNAKANGSGCPASRCGSRRQNSEKSKYHLTESPPQNTSFSVCA